MTGISYQNLCFPTKMTNTNALDTVLFNYMPLKYFELLLTKGLYFKKASEFKDKSEGDFPKGAIQNHTQGLKSLIDPELGSDLDNLLHGMLESHKNSTFINCWHRNTEFNKEMWDEFAQDEDKQEGLYIKTTPDLIYRSLSGKAAQLFNPLDSKYSPLEEVRYSNDPETEISEMVLADCINNQKSHLIKKNDFVFENELRLIINHISFFYHTGIRINSLQIESTIAREDMRIPTEEFELGYRTDNNEVIGIYIKINPSVLIDAIGTVGENIEKIREIMKEYSLSENIQIIDESEKLT